MDLIVYERHKRHKIETSLGSNSFITFLIELNNVDELDEHVVRLYLFDDEPKNYEEVGFY